MKEKFTTLDLLAVLGELRESLLGMRVINVYDIDQKTYLMKLGKPEKKAMLLFESGCRIHTTDFEWPKSLQPSGFSMKLRKHLRSRRLVSVAQLGVDRVVDLQFGSNEAAYHIIIELYDRGNVILTDHAYSILSLLRTRTDADTDVRFATRQVFSMETIKKEQPPPTVDKVREILAAASAGDQLRHLLNPHFVYGSALLSHCLLGAGLSDTVKIGSGVHPIEDVQKVLSILQEADTLFRGFKDKCGKGYLIQKRQVEPKVSAGPLEGGGAEGGAEEAVLTNVEFHPMLFRQHLQSPYKEAESFDKAVDEFFSSKTSQKQDLKALNVKKTAVKKLDNIRKDHFKRIDQLQQSQEQDTYKAQLIEMNSDLVTKACVVIRSAVANAMAWGDIELLVKDAQKRGDPVASAIKALKLKSNEITLLLQDPSDMWDESDSEEEEKEEEEVGGAAMSTKKKKKKQKATIVDIDLSLSAFANATRYYGHKKQAARKEQRTIAASEKALKSAEKKAKQTLKEASTVAKILKARKVHWFEKFYWFISSENYLVIGGRDQQQNELVVKRYLKEGDVYVHADLHGATSVVVKNSRRGSPIPPKTLEEAGFMAVCYSTAWDSRIVTSAWWVYHHQVSKTAPTGEYLTTGSFMIRGKKNFLPPCQLVLGFGFLFRVEDSCIPNHLHERKVLQEGEGSAEGGVAGAASQQDEEGEGEEVTVEESSDEGEFPDTAMTVTHIGGETYKLERGVSTSSVGGVEGEEGGVAEAAAVQEDMMEASKPHPYLTAKQKRDLRKQKQGKEPAPPPTPSGKMPSQQLQQQQQLPQHKRGQKFKQKKAREKYGDQDEEERQLMMEFLGSAGAPKESKKRVGKKGKKKAFDATQSSNPKSKYRQKDKGQGFVEQTHKQRGPRVVTVTERAAELVEAEEEVKEDTVHLSEERKEGEEDGAMEKAEEREEGGGDGAMEKAEEREEGGGDRAREQGEEEGEGAEDQEGEEGEENGEREEEERVSDQEEEERTSKESNGGSEEGDKELTTARDEEGVANGDQEGVATREEGVATGGGEEGASDEEAKAELLAEERLQQEEAEKEQLGELDALTGCPTPEDLLVYAVPVCGPYSAMLNYKYKIKLIPGNNRRGKAAKAAVHRFTQNKEATPRERDLLKSVKDNDLSRYIPGKVKMSLPQAHKQKR